MAKKKPKSKTSKPNVSSKPSASSSEHYSIDENAIAAALSSSTHQPVLAKVCRLCETRDGPFLNIFGSEKITAKQIDELMPFRIAENDGLPHKICFRCSAKVEELYEFVQKCIKTQENLQKALGKKGPAAIKPKSRALWEEKLNKTNFSNNDICEALIKRAMEGILPVDGEKSLKQKPEASPIKREKSTESSDESDDEKDQDYHDEITLKQVKLSIEKCDERTTRSKRTKPCQDTSEPAAKKMKVYEPKTPQNKTEDKSPVEEKHVTTKEPIQEPNKDEEVVLVEPKKFNIMDHVCTIKVFGVGILFQCKLCNRNFLRKDVVESHGCAKNNSPKDITQSLPNLVPEPPKPTTVKYITMDKDFKKDANRKLEQKVVVDSIDLTPKRAESLLKQKLDSPEISVKPREEVKPKPKIGPASKIRREKEPPTLIEPKGTPETGSILERPVTAPSVTFPILPSLNSRYKLVPGPNNTFTLVEDATANTTQVVSPLEPTTKPVKKKKNVFEGESSGSSKIISLDDDNTPEETNNQPYPVGLFQTAHRSNVFPPPNVPPPPAFTTPAMKKQSYTIVQTGNPSKLLISTKPQPVVEELAKKKSKKNKDIPETKEPYNVTLEENPVPKDSALFHFVNIDPLLQPSYVLPTDNIIQESQISTSTPGSKAGNTSEKYTCNMCNSTFSREKKLLAHIQSHYNQMDEEDIQREKTTKKKGKKS